MATFNLSGSGVQALTIGTTALHVTITTLPAGLTHGRANPINHFDIALFRFSDGTGFSSAIPIAGGPDWISVPTGATSLGYSVLNGAVLSVTEIFGVVSPTPSITATFPAALMPPIISAASAQTVGLEMTAHGSSGSATVNWAIANLAIYLPLRISDTYTITNAWVMNGNSPSGHWDIGIFDQSLALLGHTGSILQAGASTLQNVSFSLTLVPGFYYLAMSADTTALTVAFFTFGGAARLRVCGVRQSTSGFPLASGPTLAVPTFGVIPTFGVSKYAP